MFVKPAPGRQVRHPKTLRLLPESGKEVTLDTFWLRRLASGDVLEAKQIPDSESAIQEPEPMMDEE
jgi:hypothetical protein